MANGVAGGSGSGQQGTLDVARFLGGLPFTRFHIQLLVICSLVTFFDGLDFSLISFTLPYLREEMALTDEMTGFVSSAACSPRRGRSTSNPCPPAPRRAR